jgi:hypothetical protein
MSRARPWLFMGAALGLLVGGAALAQQPLPPPGRAVLVPTGRVGDRALVVFVGPAEMATAVRLGC